MWRWIPSDVHNFQSYNSAEFIVSSQRDLATKQERLIDQPRIVFNVSVCLSLCARASTNQTRNSAIANRSRASCAHQVTTPSSVDRWYSWHWWQVQFQLSTFTFKIKLPMTSKLFIVTVENREIYIPTCIQNTNRKPCLRNSMVSIVFNHLSWFLTSLIGHHFYNHPSIY